MRDLVENLFPEKHEAVQNPNSQAPSTPVESVEEVLIKVPGAIVHLIDKHYSVELAHGEISIVLAHGEISIVRLRQGENVVAVLVRVGDEIQWPLAKDEAAIKLDDSHYFFSLRVPAGDGSDSGEDERQQH